MALQPVAIIRMARGAAISQRCSPTIGRSSSHSTATRRSFTNSTYNRANHDNFHVHGYQGGRHDDNAVRHGRAQQSRPLFACAGRHPARAAACRSASDDADGAITGLRWSVTSSISASMAKTCRKSATGAGKTKLLADRFEPAAVKRELTTPEAVAKTLSPAASPADSLDRAQLLGPGGVNGIQVVPANASAFAASKDFEFDLQVGELFLSNHDGASATPGSSRSLAARLSALAAVASGIRTSRVVR